MTNWPRLSILQRRALDSLTILARTRDPRLVRLAAGVHSLAPVSKFVSAGGELGLDGRARFASREFALPVDLWPALWHLTGLLSGGADLTYGSDTYLLVVEGLRFALPRSEFVSGVSELAHRFTDREYDSMRVEGTVVVDIGANIGDSALYFAKRGAALVLAYEPFYRPWRVATNNIQLNRLEDRVHVLRAAVGTADGVISAHFDPSRPSYAQMTKGNETGMEERVEQISFANVVKDALAQAAGRTVVCKVDCEGCEEDIFAPGRVPSNLDELAELVIEVHTAHGWSIASTLSHCGFKVIHQAPDKLLATRNESP